MMQKLLLAILIASCKMRPYFEGHPITVVSKYNLRSPLETPLATGRISTWAMELQGFGLKFEHTDNIKSQALADFHSRVDRDGDRQPGGGNKPSREGGSRHLDHTL